MATVTAGQSATVTIPAGAAWSVTTTGEAQVYLVSGRTGAGYTSWRVTPDRPLAVAPFDAGGTIRIAGLSGTTTDAARSSETLTPEQVAATQALVSRAGNDPEPATRPGRGYVVAAGLRAAGVAATFGSPVITDVERIAPDGTKLRGIRLQSTGVGTQCSVDLAIRSQKFSTGRLSLLLYADHTSGAVDPNVALYVGDSTGLANFYVTNAQVATARGWQLMSAGLTASASNTKWIVGGTAAWGTTDFIRCRIRLDYTTATTPWIEIYEITYNEDAPKSWISISVDDGYDTAYSIGAPAFERYGMRASFAVIADLIGTAGYMTWDQLRDLRDRGHEVCVHGPLGGTGSLNNYAGSPTRNADVRADVAYHRNAIIREGLNVRGSANVYVYPQGFDRFSAGDESIRDALIAEGFVGARRASPGRQPKRNTRGSNPWTIPYMGHYWVSGGEAANIANIAAQFDAAADQKHDGALMLHRFTTGTPTVTTEIGLADLETLLTKLADNRAAGTQEPVLLSRQVYALAGLERPAV